MCIDQPGPLPGSAAEPVSMRLASYAIEHIRMCSIPHSLSVSHPFHEKYTATEYILIAC
jgi:hypothetical protein